MNKKTSLDFLPLRKYNIAMAESEVSTISPRTGRPPKNVTKSESLQMRITKETADKLQRCADKLGVTRTAIVEKGIDMVAKELDVQQKK